MKKDTVQKVYEEYRYFSDCFDLRSDSRLDKMIYLIKGIDETSKRIASKIRESHAFYSTYHIGLNLCEPPDERQLKKFISSVDVLGLHGQGMLIADEGFYKALIEKHPELENKLSLVCPDYDADYIKLMVGLNIGKQYPLRVRALKNTTDQTERINKYYTNIMPFDVLILPSVESLASLVSAAYIYQEIKLRHNLQAKVFVMSSGKIGTEKEIAARLLSKLYIEDFSFIDQSDKQGLQKVVENQRVLFITPQRSSLQKYHEVEELHTQTRFFSNFYVVEENLSELLHAPEYNHADVLQDMLDGLSSVFQSPEVLSFKRHLKKSQKELGEKDKSEQEKAIDEKAKDLMEKHQVYLRHLFKVPN